VEEWGNLGTEPILVIGFAVEGFSGGQVEEGFGEADSFSPEEGKNLTDVE
jgi:hypothetical protein